MSGRAESYSTYTEGAYLESTWHPTSEKAEPGIPWSDCQETWLHNLQHSQLVSLAHHTKALEITLLSRQLVTAPLTIPPPPPRTRRFHTPTPFH